MKVYILKEDSTEGLEEKINQIAENVQGAVNNIQYQPVVVPEMVDGKIVGNKIVYSAMVWTWG